MELRCIRSINLTYSILLIYDNNRKLFNKNYNFIKDLLLKHSYYLKNHLSLYSSAGNHLVAELIGILVLNLNFKLDINFNKYFHLLMKITPDQFFKDGFSREQSTHYFKDNLSLYLILLFNLYSNRKQKEFYILLENIKNSFSFYKDLRISSSNYFDIGDNDNSIIINDLLSRKYCEYESVFNDINFLKTLKKTNDFRNRLLRNHIISITETYQFTN